MGLELIKYTSIYNPGYDLETKELIVEQPEKYQSLNQYSIKD